MNGIIQSFFVAKKPRTGFVFEEVYMWHDSGTISFDKWVQPGEHWENPDTKRRFHGLLNASGLLDKLIIIKARQGNIYTYIFTCFENYLIIYNLIL